MLVGLATQLVGNTGQQWAMGIAGLVVTIPTLVAAVLVATSIFGWALLGERVPHRSLLAIGLLVVAVTLLCLGAETAVRTVGAEIEIPTSSLQMAAAVGAAVMAGIVFAVLSIAIRHCVTGATPPSAVVVIITGMGVVSLGPLSLYRFGWQTLIHTPVEQLQWMAGAGIFNLVAFFAVSKALQLTTAIHVNLVNASQVALAAIAGIALFGEKANLWLILGVALTLVGIFLIGRPQEPEMLDRHV
jgi:drug/metabolite transporter (DMT)-like permease